ncbi:MAG: methionine--tRNA ligase subunit beta [Candidatus Altiarchaeota archaeon]|nr:methionine--tRNA ligase subunit beta [Candidatus Altiarchaeota archaeon]
MTVSYSDFAKLDLRVGTIVSIEPLKGADKLYKFVVDLGKEKRTLVAGLRPYYNQADLHGKQVIVLTNLEPKKLKGVVSHGMVLAADDGRTVSVLRSDKKIENGSRVL